MVPKGRKNAIARGPPKSAEGRSRGKGKGECFAPFYLKIIVFCVKILFFGLETLPGWSGMILEKTSKIQISLKISHFIGNHPRSTWKHSKIKKTTIWRKNWRFLNKWCEALSLTFASGPAFGWFRGSPRWCVILTLWPNTFDRYTRQIKKSLDSYWKLS